MSSFFSALSNVALILMYLLPAFALCRAGKVRAEHMSSTSTILLYVCGPCMFINTLIHLERSPEILGKMGLFFLVTFTAEILFMLLTLLLKKQKEEFRYRMLTIASVMGNVGFFGLPIVNAMFPDAPIAAAYSCVFCVDMNILAWTVGVFCLTGERKYISLRHAFLNPTVLSVTAGLVLYLTGAKDWLPGLVQDGLRNVGAMTTPLCMFILGIRLATMDLKKLFTTPFVYGITAGKLLLFPLFSYGITLLFPLDPVFRASVLVLSATPCASILLNLAEIHGNGQELAANCALLSTLMCVITLPLLSLLL